MRLEDLPVQLAADAVAPERVVGGVDVVRLVLEREVHGPARLHVLGVDAVQIRPEQGADAADEGTPPI